MRRTLTGMVVPRLRGRAHDPPIWATWRKVCCAPALPGGPIWRQVPRPPLSKLLDKQIYLHHRLAQMGLARNHSSNV
jgi:hypothetical protein